jgi:hypothetical protein
MRVAGISWVADGWRAESLAGQDIWANECGDLLVPMRSAAPPDIPRMGGEDCERATRDYFRSVMADLKGGMIDVDYGEVGGLRAVRTLVKRTLEPRGFGFIGSWLIPFRNDFVTFRFEAVERGITGMRESVVMLSEQPEPAAYETGRILGWVKDPYDARYDEGALFNLADQRKYDAQFPDHPLSRVRGYLDDFASNATSAWWVRLRRQHVV